MESNAETIKRVMELHSVDAYIESDVCMACERYVHADTLEPGFEWVPIHDMKEAKAFLGY